MGRMPGPKRTFVASAGQILIADISLWPTVWGTIKRCLEWGGYVDFLTQHSRGGDWVSGMLDFLLAPPAWSIISGALLGGFIIWRLLTRPKTTEHTGVDTKRVIYHALSIVIIGIIIATSLYTRQYMSERYLAPFYATIGKGRKPSDILRLFENDLNGGSYIKRLSYEIKGTPDGDIEIGFNVYGDFVSNAEYIAIYIPGIPHAFDLCIALADGYKTYLSDSHTIQIVLPYPGDSSNNLDTVIIFTKVVYLYYENFFSDDQISQLKSLYRSRGLRLTLRGVPYLEYRRVGGKLL